MAAAKTTPKYIRVKNWERYQNADVFKKSDGKPPWIKLYRTLLDDYEFMHLEVEERYTLMMLWLLAAQTSNTIPNDFTWISQRIGVHELQLESLVKQGFCSYTNSRPRLEKLALRSKNEEEEEEEENPPPPLRLVEIADDASSRIHDIYDCWRTERKKTNGRYATMSPNRRLKIQTRLKEFSVEELKQAIKNVALDPWAERARHDDLTVIFRSREQVEKFLEMHSNGDGAADEPIYRRGEPGEQV